MDPEEERVLYLARVGRDKIFKYGTYTMMQQRSITQDHPFYEQREEASPKISYGYVPPVEGMQNVPEENTPAQEATPAQDFTPAPEPVDADSEALAGQIISSNFKVGLSQEEVDALLNGMN